MNNQCNSPFNYNWNAYAAPYGVNVYNSSPLATATNPSNNYPYNYLANNYSSPSVSSGYASENSFNNSPNNYSYLPYNYLISKYSTKEQSPTNPTCIQQSKSESKRQHSVETNEIVSKTKRVYKKRKQDEPVLEKPHLDEEVNEDEYDEETEENGNNYSELSQSLTSSNGERKKRVLTKGQRVAANQRERKRMNIMNEAFNDLRQALPISTGRKRRKMSRLDITIGAMEYISYLDSLLKSKGPYTINFDAYQDSLYFYD